MTNRERVLAMLRRQRPDRLPWCADLDYWAWAEIRLGNRPAGWQRQPSYFRLHESMDVGFYLQGHFGFRQTVDDTMTIDEQTESGVRRRTIITPAGTLHDRWDLVPTSFSWACREHLIKSPADLAPLAYWYSHSHFEPDSEPAQLRRRLAGENGIVLVYLPRSPFMELTVALAGITTMVDLWLADREGLEETLKIMAKASDRAAAATLEVDADAYMIPENLSSEVVGKRYYRNYVQPWEARWVEEIARRGKHSFIHMDGTLGLLRDVCETGFDVIEAVTPAPVGDLALEDLRETCGRNTVLWGGLPGVWFTPLLDEATFHQHVERTVRYMKQDGRMVLGVADQVPPDGLLERVAAVAQHL